MKSTSATPQRGCLKCAAPTRQFVWAALLLALLYPAARAQQAMITRPPAHSTAWQGPGGRHEFGLWWGYSGISGDIWGAAHNVTYMPVGLRYSYEFYRHNQAW